MVASYVFFIIAILNIVLTNVKNGGVKSVALFGIFYLSSRSK